MRDNLTGTPPEITEGIVIGFKAGTARTGAPWRSITIDAGHYTRVVYGFEGRSEWLTADLVHRRVRVQAVAPNGYFRLIRPPEVLELAPELEPVAPEPLRLIPGGRSARAVPQPPAVARCPQCDAPLPASAEGPWCRACSIADTERVFAAAAGHPGVPGWHLTFHRGDSDDADPHYDLAAFCGGQIGPRLPAPLRRDAERSRAHLRVLDGSAGARPATPTAAPDAPSAPTRKRRQARARILP